ncbi:MAG: RNA-binding S4 domain-containing protein [Mucispirillum sp.]|nr:RNA-binding S4 domain-containing protein [Mucispirillum sp.]
MRLDKFLKITQLIKRRSAANEAADEGVISVNGKRAKPSHRLKDGDIIEIDMWNYYKKIEILRIPEKNTIPKKDTDSFIKILDYKTKESEF